MPAPSPARLKGCLVLVADDDHESADGLAMLLSATLQCDVDIAYDGAQAVEKAIAQHPQAVIMDLQMPVLDGLQAARDVRQAFPGDPPLLVAISGDMAALQDARQDDHTFDRTFAKPLDFARLTEVLLEGLPSRRE